MSVKLVAAEIEDAFRRNSGRSSLAWAYALREREQHQKPGTGASLREGLTKFQREAWREALHVPRNHPASASLEAA